MRARYLLPAILALSFCGKLCAQPTISVEVEGVNEILKTNILLFLSIEQQKNSPLMSEGRMRRLNGKAQQEIEAALQPYGYYRPTISASLTEPQPDQWLARYVVDPGHGIPLAEFNLDIAGEIVDDPELQKMLDEHGLRLESVFQHPLYDSFKSRLLGLAFERGYMQAEFIRARVEIDLNAYVARVYLDFDSGPRYSFGEISLKQDVLDPDFLQRYIPFERGDPYSLDQVIRLQQTLNDTNYFQIADVSPGAPNAEAREVPIVVALTPRKDHRYDFGVGYGTDTGARAKVGWLMPRVNRRGHKINAEAVVSQIGYDVNANYRVPVFNPRTDQVVYSASQEREDTDTSDSLLRIIGVSLNHNRGEWRENLSLNYETEDFTIADQSGTSDLLIPGVSWSRTWGRDFINVFDGLRFDFGLRAADENLASDTSFTQLRGALKFIVSLDLRNRVIMRGSAGVIDTPDFDLLPSSIRFFAGGSQSVRGYDYQSLGPTDASGEVVGGPRLLTGSVEYEHYFDDYWGAAVFFDIGNAVENFSDELEQGAGFGLRWKSPIGPVRIDLANQLTGDEDWHLVVNIGPDL